jgi:hypothetical protein
MALAQPPRKLRGGGAAETARGRRRAAREARVWRACRARARARAQPLDAELPRSSGLKELVHPCNRMGNLLSWSTLAIGGETRSAPAAPGRAGACGQWPSLPSLRDDACASQGQRTWVPGGAGFGFVNFCASVHFGPPLAQCGGDLVEPEEDDVGHERHRGDVEVGAVEVVARRGEPLPVARHVF